MDIAAVKSVLENFRRTRNHGCTVGVLIDGSPNGERTENPLRESFGT